MKHSFQSSGSFSSSHIFSERLWRISVAVSRSAVNASMGILSKPDAFPFYSFSTAFLISFLVGFLMLIGRGVSAGGMSRGSWSAGWFKSSEKCSFHLLSCSWTVVRSLPCLSLTGLSACWHLPANVLVMSYRPFRFLCAAASSACLARLSMWPLLSALMLLFTSL